MSGLELLLDEAFDSLAIKQEHRESLSLFLRFIQQKDQATYEHSIRVGLLGMRIAQYMHLDPKALLFAGLVHDIGKVMVDPELLKKTEGFNGYDRHRMSKHPEYSYMLLRGVHDFSAEIALRHHKYQEHSYPKRLPQRKDMSLNTRLSIDFYARLLSLADSYDAASTRENDKFGDKRTLTREEVKDIMLRNNPDQLALINNLYTDGIFGVEPPN